MCPQKLFSFWVICGCFMQIWFTPAFEVRTSVCFRWSRCFPGSSCTTPSRWGAITTVTTSTQESQSTSAPLRTTRGPSHITTAAACRSELSRNQRLLKNWRSSGDLSDGRTGQEMMDWHWYWYCTFLSVFLYLFRASSRFYDWMCKENWQLRGLCCKEKCWMLGKCAHLLSRVWFGFTVYRKLNPGNFSLADFGANIGGSCEWSWRSFTVTLLISGSWMHLCNTCTASWIGNDNLVQD